MIVAGETFFYTVRHARNVFKENLSLDYKKLQTCDLAEIYNCENSLISLIFSIVRNWFDLVKIGAAIILY